MPILRQVLGARGTFQLEVDNPDAFSTALEAHIGDRVAEVTATAADAQATIESQSLQIKAFREPLVAELIRARKIRNESLDVEAERTHLESLDSARLIHEHAQDVVAAEPTASLSGGNYTDNEGVGDLLDSFVGGS